MSSDRVATDHETRLRFALSAARRMLYREQCDDGALGVFTARLSDGEALPTPVGFGGVATPEPIARIPLSATADELPATVSRTAAVARAIYRRRPDIRAVV